MAKEKRKFSLYLGVETADRESILSEKFRDQIAKNEATKLQNRQGAPEDLDAYYMLSRAKAPKWFKSLSEVFNVPEFKRKSPASVVVFDTADRTFAVAFGYGSRLLNERELEADFGIKVAINAVADDSLKAVQKSDVANAIQQFGQAAFKSRFGSFGGQTKFEILKRISGVVGKSDELESVVGSSGLSLTTTLKLGEIKTIAERALEFYRSDAYTKTDFAVIDEFQPVLNLPLVDELNQKLVENIRSDESTFELGYPQLNPEDAGYVKISGVGSREEFPDISLDLYKSCFENKNEVELDDLKDDSISLFNDEHDNVGRWPVYRCLVGSLEYKNTRYVLNEGSWYIPSEGIVGPVEKCFDDRKVEVDEKLDTFKILSWKKRVGNKGRNKEIPAYEKEEDFNKRISGSTNYVLFDQKWHTASDNTFSKLEVCDLYDPENLRMIHVKRTSRRSNLLSYLFEQGQRAANLWQRDDVREQFIERVKEQAGTEAATKLYEKALIADAITIEFAIADYQNARGEFTIPFLAKLTFENKVQDIELRGFKSRVRFIPLDKPEEI